MPTSVRTRFEVFKRDSFTCQYCGRKSPDVVLEADHIVPLCEGGSDDTINLATSCWECKRGKAGEPLSAVMTGEDPHDKAIRILERERELSEYNNALRAERERREAEAWTLVAHWRRSQGYKIKPTTNLHVGKEDWTWLFSALTWCPSEQIRSFMDIAISRGNHRNFKYVAGCCRNWREQCQEKELAHAG